MVLDAYISDCSIIPSCTSIQNIFILLIKLDYFSEFCQHILDIAKVNFTKEAL